MQYTFSDVTVDAAARTVTVAGRAVAMSPRVFGALLVLVERANHPVTRDALLTAVWPDAHVVPNSVTQAVGALRRGLSGSRGGWRIEALPGVGYRLVAGVEIATAGRRRHVEIAWAATAAALVMLAFGVWLARDQNDRHSAESVRLADRAAELLSSRRAGDLRSARRFYERAASLDPTSARALAGLAEASYLGGFYGVDEPVAASDEAYRAASQAIALDAGQARAYAVRASVALDRDWDLGAAGRDFQRALALDAADARTHLWSAWWCLAADLVPEARAAVDRAVALDPFSPSILTARATFAYLAGDLAAAADDSRRVIRIDPTFYRAYLRLGLSLLAAGRTAEALEHLETAHRLEPDVPETTSALAHAYAVTAHRGRAESLLTEDAARLPFYDRALVFTGLGRHDEAIAALHAARAGRRLVAGLYSAEPRLAPLGGRAGFEALRNRRAPGLPAFGPTGAPGFVAGR